MNPRLLFTAGGLNEETRTDILTWTVFQSGEGSAHVDVKPARFDHICIYGDPGAVLAVPDQVTQVILVTVGIWRQWKSMFTHTQEK